MSKYHLNLRTGEPGPCRATQHCPFGDLETEHYATQAEARVAYESYNNPWAQVVDRREDTYDWPDENEAVNRHFTALRTPGARIALSIGDCSWVGSNSRTMETWLDLPERGTVGFMKLIYEPDARPDVGPYLAMCDVETRPDSRGQGFARELRESVEAETGLLIYSSGSYTPEGWAAFGRHGRYLPNPHASGFDRPGEKHRSMGFVASWKDRVPRSMDHTIDYTDEQRDAAYELDSADVFRRMQDREILWAEQ